MSKLRPSVAKSLFLLFISVASRGEDIPAVGAFDSEKWTVRRELDVQVGTLGPVRAKLLRSVSPTGTSGIGDPLFAVSLIVTAGSRVIYAYTESSADRSFHVNDDLEARDVTSDGVPELLFDSGFVGASDRIHVHHVLYLPEGEDSLWDIAPRQFASTRRQTFRWLGFGDRTLGLIAEPVVPAGTVDPHFCHGCPHFYQYLVFSWRADRGNIVLTQVIQGERSFEDGEDPLQKDLDWIMSALRSNKPLQPARRTAPRG